ncbi:hypothetical protein KSI01_02360 [Kurthia sibirica]|nr:hypothetical protein KSI01_02360 [Kurthia sibirica]
MTTLSNSIKSSIIVGRINELKKELENPMDFQALYYFIIKLP